LEGRAGADEWKCDGDVGDDDEDSDDTDDGADGDLLFEDVHADDDLPDREMCYVRAKMYHAGAGDWRSTYVVYDAAFGFMPAVTRILANQLELAEGIVAARSIDSEQ
jgi:hypothetical protein